ncbi:MAG: ferritin [Phycisphaerales bacterium]|nr:ferritin [Phycisphaerales bacterium]
MAISAQLNAKLNEQITNEFFASQTYLSMSCMFEELGLRNLSKMFRTQSDEERGHALKILDYIPTVEGKVKLAPIPAPQETWESVLAAIEASLEHERKVTSQVHELMALAIKESDYATQSFLKWYVDEQVEEVDSQQQLVQVAKMAGHHMIMLEAYIIHLNK